MNELRSLQQIWGVVLVFAAVFFLFFALWAVGCGGPQKEEEEEEEARDAMRSEPLRTAPINGHWTHAHHLRLARDRIPPTLLEPLRIR